MTMTEFVGSLGIKSCASHAENIFALTPVNSVTVSKQRLAKHR